MIIKIREFFKKLFGKPTNLKDEVLFLASMQKLDVKVGCCFWHGDILIIKYPGKLRKDICENIKKTIAQIGFNVKVFVLEEGKEIL